MSLYDYQVSKQISAKDYPFYALIMAAYRQADDLNQQIIEGSWPRLAAEFKGRYSAPGGLLPGETINPEDGQVIDRDDDETVDATYGADDEELDPRNDDFDADDDDLDDGDRRHAEPGDDDYEPDLDAEVSDEEDDDVDNDTDYDDDSDDSDDDDEELEALGDIVDDDASDGVFWGVAHELGIDP